jgi:large subunit ribosomal protein L18
MTRRTSASSPTYRVPFRRRREGKTDYQKRLKLLLGRKPRVVVRKSNKYIRIQLVSEDKLGDKTFVAVISSELGGYGYEGGKCNMPATYLTGLLFGKKAKEVGFDDAILDIGLHTPVHGSNVYAALKGALDSGMTIPHDTAVFPSDERIRGEHIAKFLKDTSILDNFDSVKEKIMAEEEGGKEHTAT